MKDDKSLPTFLERNILMKDDLEDHSIRFLRILCYYLIFQGQKEKDIDSAKTMTSAWSPTPDDYDSSKKFVVFYLVRSIFGIIFLFIFVGILWWLCKQKKQNIKIIEQETEEAAILGWITIELLQNPARFSSKEIAASTCNYSTKLGSGGFGDVYKGEFPGGVKLAVKVLKNIGLEKRLEEQFMAEVGTIGRTYHINLVRLFGFCFEHDIKALVYEYMENGSLDNVLFNNRNDIKWEKLYKIAVGAAKGLEYLHHLGRQRIIHYDIKPANILINSKFCAKIADFGLARLCNKDSTHVTFSGCRGTPGYAAPELWMPFPVTYKCDVYSFGMMLFEIIGRKRNLTINSSESQEWFPRIVWEKYDKGELELLIADNIKEEKDRDSAKTMAMVALWCVQYLPEARPSMSSVVKILENEVEVKKPPNPFQHLLSSNAELPQWIETSSISTSTGATLNDIGKNATPLMRKHELEFASLP